jgi:membrane peptidoglycan carboxypeptidase
MSKTSNDGGRRTTKLGRKSKNTFVTKSGQTIKINRNLKDRFVAARDARSKRRAVRLAGMPKGRIQRFFYRLHPKRLYKYWFSRDGLVMALKITGFGILACFLFAFGVFAYFRKDLPNLREINSSKIGGSIRYYDKTGQTLLWEDYDAVKRIPVEDANISQHMRNATIAVEDKDFFKHGGFDVRGILRAGVNDVFGSGGTQGGSTITQQLVKLNQNWSRDRTLTRKAKELILAVELEREYSKQQILNGYLNAAPYGGIEYGVEAAARDYFQKSAKDLTIDEAAMLAAIPKSPTYYSPYTPNFATGTNKEDLLGRQRYIIDVMASERMITKEEATAAKKIDVLAKVKPRVSKYNNIKAPWFVLAAKEQMEAQFTNSTYNRGGWKVTTSLDLGLQDLAEQQVAKGLPLIKRYGGDMAAFVAEDVKTGQVVALVGGADFSNPEYGQNNYAADYKLPPGSSIKPYDYAALIEHNNNFGAGTVLYDTTGPLEGYPCTIKTGKNTNCAHDYDFRTPGPITLRYALGGSRNIPAFKAMLITGIDKTIETADKIMGNPNGYQCYSDEALTKPNQCGSSAAIGDGAYLHLTDHVNGFSTLARNGLQIKQSFIVKIEDGNKKVIDEWKPDKGTQAVRPDAAFIVSDMISDPNASYFSPGTKPHRYNNGQGTWKFGMKTGTTNDNKDGWMMGFSSQYAAGLWIGYHNRTKAFTTDTGTMTLPIWNGWMKGAHANLKPIDIQKPSGVQTLPAFVVRNHVGFGSIEPSPANDLYPSWYKAPGKGTGKAQTIDIISNKLATDCTPARARKEVFNSDVNQFSGDKFATGSGAAAANTSEKDDVHICGEAKPSISIDSGSPASCSGTCTINVTVGQGAHPLSSDRYKGTVNVLIGGQIVQSYQVDNPGGGIPLSFTYTGSGSQQVTAQIIDSVLYDAPSQAVEIDFTGGGGGSSSNLTLNDPVVTGNSVNFSWSGGSGVYTVTVKGPSPSTITVGSCSSNGTTCGPVSVVAHGTYTATLTDGNGDTSTKSFTR